MFTKGLYLCAVVSIASATFFACSTRQPSPPPNIILILGDDMGYSDLHCYGGEINTPHLDGLAATGVRFTQFYNGARCCPTRASLLTGLYPHQAGVGHMMRDRGTPAFQGDLSFNAVTIAEVLKTTGYSTYMSGKWHVTPYLPKEGLNPPKHNWPRQRGFDKFFGTILGAGSLFDPAGLAEDNEYIAPYEGFYYTEAISRYAVDRIRKHEGDKPFFMYVAYTAAHWPMHAWPKDIAQYDGKYDNGWDAIRASRIERMREMGLVQPRWQLTARDTLVESWAEATDKEWESANMEVYAAMVTAMDRGIGQIVDAVKAEGKFDNTLIFFLQDNGACAEELGWINREVAKPRAMEPGEIQFDMVPQVTRDGKPVRLMKDAMPGPAESYTAYGKPWANASNTPFRMYKHWSHEGGISTPLIVSYPGRIQQQGGLLHFPSHLIDIMATCVDVAGANYPSTYNGNDITPLEGVSLLPVLGGTNPQREAIYWEHEGNRAVRMGKWKLISKAGPNPFRYDSVEELPLEEWELYDMEADRTETNDLAAQYPERCKEMAEMWLTWARKVGAVPRPN